MPNHQRVSELAGRLIMLAAIFGIFKVIDIAQWFFWAGIVFLVCAWVVECIRK
jgi:hypothetical protein